MGENNHLVFVVTVSLPRFSDVELFQHTAFKKKVYCIRGLSYVDMNILLYIFGMHAMQFYVIETQFFKFHKEGMDNISKVSLKTMKRICSRNAYESLVKKVLSMLAYQLLSLSLTQNLFVLPGNLFKTKSLWLTNTI